MSKISLAYSFFLIFSLALQVDAKEKNYVNSRNYNDSKLYLPSSSIVNNDQLQKISAKKIKVENPKMFTFSFKYNLKTNLIEKDFKKTETNGFEAGLNYRINNEWEASTSLETIINTHSFQLYEADVNDQEFTWSAELDYTKLIYHNFNISVSGGLSLPLGEQNKYEQSKGEFFGKFGTSNSFFNGLYVIVNKIDANLINQSYQISPSTLKVNVSDYYNYSLVNILTLNKMIRFNLGGKISNLHYFDNSNEIKSAIFIGGGINYRFFEFNLALINSNYEETKLGPIVFDEYNNIISTGLGVTF